MENEVLAALKDVDDPELGVNIVDLGLVRSLTVGEAHVAVTLMMTTPTCPLGALIVETARAAVETRLGAGWTVDVTLDRAAVWTPDMASEAARARFEPKTLDVFATLKTALGRLVG